MVCRSLLTHHCSLLVLLALLAGCAIPHVPSRTIYEDPVNYVRLVQEEHFLPEWPPPHHSHPAIIGPEKLRLIFQGLMIQERRIWLQNWLQGEAPFTPAFQDEDIALLSVHVADALSKAQPNERVTFYLSHWIVRASISLNPSKLGALENGSTFHSLASRSWLSPCWRQLFTT